MKFGENTYTAHDLRKLKKEIEKFPVKTSIAKIGKELCGSWGKTERTLKRWIIIAMSYSDEIIDLFEAGKINRNRLSRIAESDFPNPAYKEFLARKAIELNLSYRQLDEIHEYIKAGRSPKEAIDITQGVRPAKPITRNDALSIERLVKEWEKDGFAWRQRAELIQQQGKIQVVQNGRLSNRIAYTLAAMKVIVGDMNRYVEDLWKEVPQELRDAVEAEFRGEPQTHSDKPRSPVREVTMELPTVVQVADDHEVQAGPVLEAEPSLEPGVEADT